MMAHPHGHWALAGAVGGFLGVGDSCWDENAAQAECHAEVRCTYCNEVVARFGPSFNGAFYASPCCQARGGTDTSVVAMAPDAGSSEIRMDASATIKVRVWITY